MASESSHHSASRANGVLPVTAAQTAGKPAVKAVNPKLKFKIRRLAPGLTEAEFVEILGDEWAVGRGKVDWVSYKPGKVSKNPSKASEPSRAYLHLVHEDHVDALAESVRSRSFEDALNSWKDSCLLGPPTIELSTYGKVPSGKYRSDARQGTIDMDPDFQSYLEHLANPPTNKDAATEDSTEEEKANKEAVKTTPLVQFLKEKKANKGKEVAIPTKPGKPVTAKSNSKLSATSSEESPKKKGKDAKIERLVGKAAKEAVKVLSREAVTKDSPSTAPATSSTPTVAAPQEPAVKTPRAIARERGSIAAAARLIQRDLGLSPSNAHRKAKANIAAADAEAASAGESSSSSNSKSQSSATPTGPRATTVSESRSRGRGNRGANAAESAANKASGSGKSSTYTPPSTTPLAGITLLKKPAAETPAQPISTLTPARTPTPAARTNTPAQAETQHVPSGPSSSSRQSMPTAPASSSRQRNPPTQPTPSAGATRAFVKHANPSQGITEALLKEALEAYGPISSVEIDKRKGFAYVDFVDAVGLVKAMKANPVKIANGTVQVLERRDRESGGGRAARTTPNTSDNVASSSTGGGAGGNAGGNGGGRNGGRSGRGGGAGGAGGTTGRNRGRNGRGAGGSGSATAPPASAPAASK